MVGLDGLLETAQGSWPELIEHSPGGTQRIVAQLIETAGALAAVGQQPCPFEHREVETHRLLGHRELRRDLSRGKLPVLHQSQDLAAVRVGERFEDRVN
jgi:hypothetical protein